jgi:translation initiation factor 2 beta subunit (eIF-2beta)/eIF-5
LKYEGLCGKIYEERSQVVNGECFLSESLIVQFSER